MTLWELRKVPFKYQLSDWTLFSIALPLQCRSATLLGAPVPASQPPDTERQPESEGFMIRALPIEERLPPLTRTGSGCPQAKRARCTSALL